mgnify:CR=1 FL=1
MNLRSYNKHPLIIGIRNLTNSKYLDVIGVMVSFGNTFATSCGVLRYGSNTSNGTNLSILPNAALDFSPYDLEISFLKMSKNTFF